jgi:5-methylcytosine-specific restriction endonuclease McrA
LKTKQFNDLNIYNFGNEIGISAVVLSGKGDNLIVPLPNADFEENIDFSMLEITFEEWQKLSFQLDTLECILHPNDKTKLQKTIVRKTQRIIDNNVSWRVFQRDNYSCRYCGKTGIPLSVDHLVTWEDLGNSVMENLITSCKKCNKIRGNKQFVEWVETDYYKNSINKINYVSVVTPHQLNIAAWEIAKKVPKRKLQRGR